MDERVVVVDDDAIILKQANMVLAEAGFKVTCLKRKASDGLYRSQSGGHSFARYKNA